MPDSVRKPTVLYIEDARSIVELCRIMAGGPQSVWILAATNIASAKFTWNFMDNPNDQIDLIVLDGSVPFTAEDEKDWLDPRLHKDDLLTTPPLIEWFREHGYKGEFLAASGEPKSNERLVSAGCKYKIPDTDNPKLAVAGMIVDILCDRFNQT